MSIINLSMLSSSWSNAMFMRRNGSLAAAANIASSIATLVASGLFSAATLIHQRDLSSNRHPSRFSLRMTSDQLEKITSCLFAAWWLTQAFNLSNMLFVFRDEIHRCTHPRLPRSRMMREEEIASLRSAAAACAAFRGCVVLNWMVWFAWVVRAWRTFTRSNIHFDSNIFREPAEYEHADAYSIKNLAALPPMPINPVTFSPRYPDGPRLSRNQGNPPAPLSDASSDVSDAPHQAIRQQHPAVEAVSYGCAHCRPSAYGAGELQAVANQQPRAAPVYHQAVMYTQGHHRQYVQPQNNVGNIANTGPVAHTGADNGCCQTPAAPVVGTATLATEPIHPHVGMSGSFSVQ
ncbi:hypothetical protein GGI15_002809 [Coemansia interrupta]|uniref:Uncharacterized protein n=1 Tax=Coemansia interrupta TaxID=1126814 RepID=A0A9W8HIN3_9FUNG|nr:hypothetical protein GGI15_002809 [Coemansia interrupta]